MNESLPANAKTRGLTRSDSDRQHLRELLLEGASSPLVTAADGAYFDGLRQRAAEGAQSTQ